MIDVRQHFRFTLQRVFNTPLVLRPEKAEMIRVMLSERLSASSDFAFDNFEEDDRRDNRRPYVVKEGVAIVPICGTLVQKLGTLRPWCGMMGYDGIRAQIGMALADDEVDGILLDIDSPGGEVAGCFDLADALYEARGVKPIWASVNEQCCSGAYALGSAADRLDIAGTGVAGSIGVVWMHVDASGFNTKQGIQVTYLTYGDRKVDGNPYEPLGDEAAARIQSQIDKVGERFVATVAKHRDLSRDDVRDQQAGVFMGEDAVDLRLADTVMPIDQTFSEFLKELND